MIEYLPGTKALLSYRDDQGQDRSSIVEVVRRHAVQETVRYAVKAREQVFTQIEHQPEATSMPYLEKGWKIGVVTPDLLRPLGQRQFRIVQ